MKPRDVPSEFELEAAQSCFRGRVLAPKYDSTSRLITVQARGHGGVENPTDDYEKPETVQAVPVLFPYGFAAMPPADTELMFQETPAGLVVVSQRAQLPSGVPNQSSGDSLQYSAGGSYTHHDADGDTVIEPNSGKDVALGKSATKAIAIHQDAVNIDAPPMGGGFNTWCAAVKAALDIIASAAGNDLVPTITGPGSVPTKIGEVQASATKAKAE